MQLYIKVSARAAANIRQAAGWWAENRPAVPGAVRTDIGEALALLARQPGIGVTYKSGRAKDVRRLLLGRIRYFVYDRVTSETPEVLALWHMSRGKQPLL